MDAKHCDEEQVLTGNEWRMEALAVINDIKDHVWEVDIADNSINNCQIICLNLTTKEKNRYCIELTTNGFRVVGNEYNSTDFVSNDYYETPYALLDKLSPKYRQAFGDALVSKLSLLHSSPQTD